jgi:UDP-N-acetyl-D-mannosaminuronic acid transferase (WecB/TagA/CpsF family)
VDADITLRRIMETAERLEPFRYVATPGVQQLVQLAREPDLTPLYADAWLVVCDSRILEVLGQSQGLKLRAAPRADLIQRLFAEAVDPADSLSIIGGNAATVEALKARYGLSSVHWHDPPDDLCNKPGAIAEAAAFAAAHPSKLVLIAVDSPQQEVVARTIQQRGDAVGVGLCVGSSLDQLAQAGSEPPPWMRKARIGWLFRLGRGPRRSLWRALADRLDILGLWLSQLLRKKT